MSRRREIDGMDNSNCSKDLLCIHGVNMKKYNQKHEVQEERK